MDINDLKKKFQIRKDGTKVYTQGQITAFINQAAIDNKGLTPYRVSGTCHTCGKKGVAHPKSSYCFNCDTDNW